MTKSNKPLQNFTEFKYCKRCHSELKIPNLSKLKKVELRKLEKENLPLQALKKLRTEHELTLREAKVLIVHINENYGHCIRCNFNELVKENIDCPKCKAFNLNWNTEK